MKDTMSAEDDDHPSVVPAEHEAEIGRVARNYGHLEYLIDLTIWEAARVEQQFGACLTAQIMQVDQRRNPAIGRANRSIRYLFPYSRKTWVPACAGMTGGVVGKTLPSPDPSPAGRGTRRSGAPPPS